MSSERGFTLIELMVAIVILSVGLLAMAATTGAITGTLTGSRFATVASQVALRRADMLRAVANSTVPRCTAAAFASSGAAVSTMNVTESWVVPATGSLRVVQVITTYPIGRGKTKTDTLATSIAC